MIEKIIESSIRNRYLVMFLAAGLAVWGIYAVLHTPVDAIPDLSENQVIVFTDWMGRSPKEIEDQVTYPLSLKLQGLAGVKAVRSSSEFNFSMITIIFEDNVDYYFARQRVLERLTLAPTFLPEGVVPYLAPDATALGQVYWYTVEAPGHDPARLWALQKYYIAPQLNAAGGVAEVATVGGTPMEYQIDVNPNALRAYGLTLGDLYHAISGSNAAFGGGVIHKNNAEYLIRGVGWIEGKEDIENTVIMDVNGVPIYVKNVATVQLGQQFRRSVFEKDGNEVVGGVVMMRYGENPLAVTQRVKDKIQEIQPGLPKGVRIVPAYDRTRLIHGAIDTLTTVMWHEILIASVAVFLILLHVRSAFVICVTLPLSVLFAFLLMWVLRQLGIIDIQANIMSLAGITIAIGILVDQAIVMTENASHHLKEKFGDRKVTGDTRDIVIKSCRTVGRPIFFSVMIMLISFIPVFALSGREGKLFHPLAFTKSFALVGVALISVTLVPALIPTFIRGRLRSEEQNLIVRSFINIYKPVLTWALNRRNLVMWAFAALLILAAGMFPLQAILKIFTWETLFIVVWAIVTGLTVYFIQGFHRQAAAFASLVLLGMIAFHFPKIGVTFMPDLDEGSILDMPVTAPRVSITQAADDLKARDALIRAFPEVESVIGKAGRADTPTDPAPLDMVETFVNLRPKELWPKRAMHYHDALAQSQAVLRALEEKGYVKEALADDRDAMVNDVTMASLNRFNETMRELAVRRYHEFERGARNQDLGPLLTRFVIEETLRRFRQAGELHWPKGADETKEAATLAQQLTPEYGPWLARNPTLEDVTRLTRDIAQHLVEMGALHNPSEALAIKRSLLGRAYAETLAVLGAERKTFVGEVLKAVEDRRTALWRERVEKINWELFDRGVETYTWAALEEFARSAQEKKLHDGAARGTELSQFRKEVAKADDADSTVLQPFVTLRQELEKPFAAKLFMHRRLGGPKGDLLEEMDTVLQVPGWSNIWTQPIINRVNMLSTGVRTQIGVKVFGPDLESVDKASKDIEAVLKEVDGARDVIAAPIMGKGYLEIKIDRHKAAQYGFSIQDVQDVVEVALGGKAITQTVEGRERFPVRLRYARDFREDEESIRRLLVSHHERPPMMAQATPHMTAPGHAAAANPPLQIPLGKIADVQIVEGPSMIRSENGRLLNYVTLNVRGDRDIVGFVDEAQRVVAEEVELPEGVHIEWSGEFEHQVRGARTLLFVIPVVVVLIFVILYLTYKDFMDACLMMLAVPEALAGGVFFQFLFPKIMHGWSAPPVEFSMAVWVGYIACFGMATETGIIMLVYLREAIDKRGGLENIKSLDELRQAVIEGAVHRLRPKLLTEGVAIIAIAPMLFASGVGAEIIAPMAIPVLGGLLISDEVVDIFLPVRFYWVRRARWLKLQQEREAAKEQEREAALTETEVMEAVAV